MRPRNHDIPAPRSISAVALAAMALASVLAYLRAPLNCYAFDDVAILANPLLHALRTLPHTLASAWWFERGHLYRPLTLVTLGADQLAGGGAPWLPHAVNVALHAAVALLVTRLYARFLPARAALAAGLLFALLPVHAEAVASVVGRAELLCALSLVALLLLVTRDSEPTRRARLLALVLAAAALASKEGGIAAPLLAFAAAWARPSQRAHAAQWAAAALGGVAILLAARFAALGAFGGDLAHPAFRVGDAGQRILLALSMLPRSTAMLVLPVPPAIDYAPPLSAVRHPDLLLVACGVALLAGGLFALGRHVRRPSAATLGVIVVAATIAPTSNLLFASGVVLSGRTLYAPSIGAGMVTGAAIAWLLRSRVRPLVPYAVAIVLGCAAVVTWREVPVWHDSDTVLAAMTERQPDDYHVHSFPAYASRDEGRMAESLVHFRDAIARFPADPEILTDAATVALRVHDTTSADEWLRAALAANAGAARARTRLADLLRARGDRSGREALLREGLRLDPGQRVWAEMLESRSR
jgi:hypothetical protein